MIGNHVIITGVSYYFQLKDYFKYLSHLATTTLTRVMQTQIAPENNQLLLLFYSEGSSCSAQAFSISSQVSSDKSVECIEKENLICNSVTSNYCYSPVLKKTQIPLTQWKLKPSLKLDLWSEINFFQINDYNLLFLDLKSFNKNLTSLVQRREIKLTYKTLSSTIVPLLHIASNWMSSDRIFVFKFFIRWPFIAFCLSCDKLIRSYLGSVKFFVINNRKNYCTSKHFNDSK